MTIGLLPKNCLQSYLLLSEVLSPRLNQLRIYTEWYRHLYKLRCHKDYVQFYLPEKEENIVVKILSTLFDNNIEGCVVKPNK